MVVTFHLHSPHLITLQSRAKHGNGNLTNAANRAVAYCGETVSQMHGLQQSYGFPIISCEQCACTCLSVCACLCVCVSFGWSWVKSTDLVSNKDRFKLSLPAPISFHRNSDTQTQTVNVHSRRSENIHFFPEQFLWWRMHRNVMTSVWNHLLEKAGSSWLYSLWGFKTYIPVIVSKHVWKREETFGELVMRSELAGIIITPTPDMFNWGQPCGNPAHEVQNDLSHIMDKPSDWRCEEQAILRVALNHLKLDK